jgi:hypothetical protein
VDIFEARSGVLAATVLINRSNLIITIPLGPNQIDWASHASHCSHIQFHLIGMSPTMRLVQNLLDFILAPNVRSDQAFHLLSHFQSHIQGIILLQQMIASVDCSLWDSSLACFLLEISLIVGLVLFAVLFVNLPVAFLALFGT